MCEYFEKYLEWKDVRKSCIINDNDNIENL